MGTDEEDYPHLSAAPPTNEELTKDLKDLNYHTFKLHTTAMKESTFLANLKALDPTPSLIEYAELDVELTSKIQEAWREQNPVLTEQWKPDEGKSTTAAEALAKARQNTQASPTGRLSNMQYQNRMLQQPQFQNYLRRQAQPVYYHASRTSWVRINPVEFENLLHMRRIVRVPDFDKPHNDRKIAAFELDTGQRLGIQLRTLVGNDQQQLIGLTKSSTRLQGRLDLVVYRQPSGTVNLDLVIENPRGPHTIARSLTSAPDWRLPFYKEEE